jgi:hypothetical protein
LYCEIIIRVIKYNCRSRESWNPDFIKENRVKLSSNFIGCIVIGFSIFICIKASAAPAKPSIVIFDANKSSKSLEKLFESENFKVQTADEAAMLQLAESKPAMLVIAPNNVFPANARKELGKYLSQGGNLMVLSPTAFDYNIETFDPVPVAKFAPMEIISYAKDIDEEIVTVEMPAGSLLEKQIEQQFVSVPGQNGRGVEIKTPKVCDIFFKIPLYKFRDAQRDIICFHAKGDYEIDVLTLILKDTSKRKRVAFSKLDRDWNYYEVRMADFIAVDSNLADNQFDPTQADELMIGLSARILSTDTAGSFALGQVDLARTRTNSGIPSQELRRWREPLENYPAAFPDWLISPFLDAKQINNAVKLIAASGQSVHTEPSVDIAGTVFEIPAIDVNKPIVRGHVAEDVTKDLERDGMRRIPLLTAIDKDGKVLGNVAEVRVLTGGYFKGASLALFGLPNAEYSKDTLYGRLALDTAKYVLRTPKLLQVVACTVSPDKDPNALQCELLIQNPLDKEVQADIRITMADGLISAQKKIVLQPCKTQKELVAIAAIPENFPIVKFDWKISLKTGQTNDSMQDSIDIEKSLIKSAKYMLTLMDGHKDGRISNHFFADIYGVRALHSLGLYLKENPDVVKRNQNMLGTTNAQDFLNAAYRWCDMIVSEQEDEGGFPLGYFQLAKIRWVADNGSVALGLTQIASWTDEPRSEKYLNAVKKYLDWRETFYRTPEMSAWLKTIYTGEKNDEMTKPGNYGFGYMPYDRATRERWPQRRIEYRGESFVIGCSFAVPAAIFQMVPDPEYKKIADRDITNFLDGDYSAESHFQSEGLLWLYQIVDSDTKKRIIERLNSTFTNRIISDQQHTWFGKGGRFSLSWLTAAYFYNYLENSQRIRASLVRAIWEHCSESSSFSIETLSRKYNCSGYGKSLAASKYCGNHSAIWMMELLQPGSTLLKDRPLIK